MLTEDNTLSQLALINLNKIPEKCYFRQQTLQKNFSLSTNSIEMSSPKLINTGQRRILVIADIRGEISKLNDLASEYNADLIIHTGNFGFLDRHSIDRIHESYLRHIVEFCPLLPESLILEISKLSKVNGHAVEHLSNEHENLRKLLRNHSLSELEDFISGKSKLEVPVYTIYGMCEDSVVINKFRYHIYSVPNLHIIDDTAVSVVDLPEGHKILLAGIGGSLSYHKLFHQGSPVNFEDIIGADRSITDIEDYERLLPVSGDPGNIWITILQLGKLIETLIEFSLRDPNTYADAIKIFVTHQSPAREPLLEHLSIFFKMDYTISNSLHFRYSSSYNELSINPSFESFKVKFNECRHKFAVIWKNVQPKFEKILFALDSQELIECTQLALEVFDKIPISSKGSEEIFPFQLKHPTLDINGPVDNENEAGVNRPARQRELNAIIRQLNDLYYIAFQNSWHFNICDCVCGHLILDFKNGHISTKSVSKGFDFSYRLSETGGAKAEKNDSSSQNVDEDSTSSGHRNGLSSGSNSPSHLRRGRRPFGHGASIRGGRGGRGRGGRGSVRSRGSYRRD